MKVIKVGGGCLRNKKTIAEILALLAERARGHIVVVSALSGITDLLIDGMKTCLLDEGAIASVVGRVKNRHMLVARHLMPAGPRLRNYTRDCNRTLTGLERLYYGLNFTREITPRIADVVASYGERLSAQLLSAAMNTNGTKATHRLPEDLGVVTDGKYGDATADVKQTEKQLRQRLRPMMKSGQVLFVPGFYGVSRDGEITTFGRGGSDYAAAVLAAASGAECLEIWKDVDGFLSADPRILPEASLIGELSYDEAAELAYFGAKILHPRTVEPLRAKRLPILIKNTLDPDGTGSRIAAGRRVSSEVVKSVAHTTDIGILKVHASGVGMRRGILGEVAAAVAADGINIKSVVTSQTSISLLLARRDVGPARRALMAMKPRPFRRLGAAETAALVAIVGEGLSRKPGIAARCFTAAAECAVNVEMIAFGPSPVALYFIVKETDLHKAVAAIHRHFFSAPQCLIYEHLIPLGTKKCTGRR